MKPTEPKTVQARNLEYAEAIGWTFVSKEGALLGKFRHLHTGIYRLRNEVQKPVIAQNNINSPRIANFK